MPLIKMPTRRQQRVGELIHQEISGLLQRRMGDPRLAYVTVLDVVVSPDLKQAKVLVSALGERESRESALDGLKHASGYIRRELSHSLPLRVTPELSFVLDDSWQRLAHIDELLEQVKRDGSD